MPRVTVVNDNRDFLDLLRDILEDDRYTPTTIDGDSEDAIERIRDSRPDLLMIDLRLGTDELHGWDIAQHVRADTTLANVPILLCSGDLQALQAMDDHMEDHRHVRTLAKPFSIDELTGTIDALLAEAAPA